MYKNHLQGYAIPAYFNWDTGTIGPYHLVPEFTYSDDYHGSIAEPNKRHLYQMLREDDTLLAVFFVNATFVCCLKSDGTYYYRHIQERLDYQGKGRWSGSIPEAVCVGYMKTRYACQSVYMPPAKVIYSAKRKAINMDGKWIPINDDIDVSADLPLSLYSELIHSDHEYLYIKGGNVVWKDC